MTRLNAILPVPYTARGIGYSCGALLAGMASDEFEPILTTPYATKPAPQPVSLRQTLPGLHGRVIFSYAKAAAKRWTERQFLGEARRLGRQSVSYIWSDTSQAFADELRGTRSFVLREKTNCGKALSKQVLDEAYRRLDLPPSHGITEEAIAEEKRRFDASDAIFCPNAFVESSLEEIGVPERKRLATSYGFDPQRLSGRDRVLDPVEGTTFLFVGTICVRKGAHLVLDAFAASGVKGRLILAGRLESEIQSLCAAQLAQPNVTVLPYVADVGSLYRSADVFVFPTLEEGGPQVTYEAAYCGLPSLVTPMGAGRVVRDGIEGYMVQPYDRDGWIEAIRALAGNDACRRRMGAAAHVRSLDYTWTRVGAERARLLKRALA